MKADDLIERLLRQRENRLEVAPGKYLRVRRPDAVDAANLSRLRDADRLAEWYAARVVGWEGITEADLLGAKQASDTPADFSERLVLVVLRDRPEWLEALSKHVRDELETHAKAQEAVAKN